MEKTMSRRAALALAVTGSALVVSPVLALPTASAIPSMVQRYRDAKVCVDAARAAHEPLAEQVEQFNERNPITYRLPGFRSHALANVTKMSPATIRERYHDMYGIMSGKSGLRLVGGQFVKLDYAADLERDLAQALLNHDEALQTLLQRYVDMGEDAASQALDAALDEQDAALMAIVNHSPKNAAEARDKSAALLEVLDADSTMLTWDYAVRALITSIGAEA